VDERIETKFKNERMMEEEALGNQIQVYIVEVGEMPG